MWEKQIYNYKFSLQVHSYKAKLLPQNYLHTSH